MSPGNGSQQVGEPRLDSEPNQSTVPRQGDRVQQGSNPLVSDLVDLLHRHKNLLLTGVSGTGKTYLAQQVAHALVGGGKPGQIEQVAFHPSYDYAVFVEGLRPSGAGFALEPGLFKSFCGRALEQPEQPFVFIIDDLNQGDVHTILGEVVMLLDPDYRGVEHRIKTQYHSVLARSYQAALAAQDQAVLSSIKFADGFFVPHNVFVIATMNEFEGRAEPLDSAVLRRFVCYELKPQDRMSMLKEGNLAVCAQLNGAQDKLTNAHFYD